MKGVLFLGITLSVEIRLFGILRQLTGRSSILIPQPPARETPWTVGDVLVALAKQYPDLEKELFSSTKKAINPIFRLLLNSKEITFKDPLKQPVKLGDILQFFPPVSGGNTTT
ncbi:MAG: MoaD/ThiS family protein [Candidatus Ranarchaeia archaeon]|jgi:MoaD family protein